MGTGCAAGSAEAPPTPLNLRCSCNFFNLETGVFMTLCDLSTGVSGVPAETSLSVLWYGVAAPRPRLLERSALSGSSSSDSGASRLFLDDADENSLVLLGSTIPWLVVLFKPGSMNCDPGTTVLPAAAPKFPNAEVPVLVPKDGVVGLSPPTAVPNGEAVGPLLPKANDGVDGFSDATADVLLPLLERQVSLKRYWTRHNLKMSPTLFQTKLLHQP